MSCLSVRRSSALLLVATAAAACLGSAGEAEAAPVKCTIKSYTPGKFILGASKVARNFDVTTSSGCRDRTWRIAFGGTPLLDAADGLTALSIDPTLITNPAAGMATVTITAKSKASGAARGTKNFEFYLQRRSTWGKSFNVGAEPATVGDTLKVVGTLKRVRWATSPSYVTYAGRKVRVQFKAVGTKKFVTVKRTTTAAGGKVSTTVQATSSGTWRLRYAGNSTTGASNSTFDAVKVMR